MKNIKPISFGKNNQNISPALSTCFTRDHSPNARNNRIVIRLRWASALIWLKNLPKVEFLFYIILNVYNFTKISIFI